MHTELTGRSGKVQCIFQSNEKIIKACVICEYYCGYWAEKPGEERQR